MDRRLAPIALMPALALALAQPAQAEVENCMVITTVPTTLSSQGLYCLTGDLSTAIASGAAITVAANNITIDCNGYKLGGLNAGDTTRTDGILAEDRMNTVVRNCSIRGFLHGVLFDGGGGHVAEDNRFDGNTYSAVGSLFTSGDIIRNNHIVDTGGNIPFDSFPNGAVFAIGLQEVTGALVEHNSISDTFATPTSNKSANAIGMFSTGGIIRDNHVQSVLADGTGVPYGIYVNGSTIVARDNIVMNSGVAGYGIFAGAGSYCAGNTSLGFTTGTVFGCTDGGGNGGLP